MLLLLLRLQPLLSLLLLIPAMNLSRSKPPNSSCFALHHCATVATVLLLPLLLSTLLLLVLLSLTLPANSLLLTVVAAPAPLPRPKPRPLPRCHFDSL
jgi:hypothetical protein